MAGGQQDGVPFEIKQVGARVNDDITFAFSQDQIGKSATAIGQQCGTPITGGGCQRLLDSLKGLTGAEEKFATEAKQGGQIYQTVAASTAQDYESTAQLDANRIQALTAELQRSLDMSGQSIDGPDYKNWVDIDHANAGHP